jgi:hypothetical protein
MTNFFKCDDSVREHELVRFLYDHQKEIYKQRVHGEMHFGTHAKRIIVPPKFAQALIVGAPATFLGMPVVAYAGPLGEVFDTHDFVFVDFGLADMPVERLPFTKPLRYSEDQS